MNAMPETVPDLAGWARFYRDKMSWQIVPCRDKYPDLPSADGSSGRGSWKQYQHEQVPESVFQSWLTRNPVGIGMLTGNCSGGIWGLDLDVRKDVNPAGLDWFLPLLQQAGYDAPNLLPTAIARTPSGGLHIYFLPPEGKNPPRTAKFPALGLDIRGEGGFIVLPPTPGYEWVRQDRPMRAPAWLVAAMDGLAGHHAEAVQHTERTASPAGATGGVMYDNWGKVIDGREGLMSEWAWGFAVDLYRETGGKLPPLALLTQMIAERYQAWELKVAARHPHGLEAEGRGPTAFRQKFLAALQQWDIKVAEAARSRPFVDNVHPFPPGGGQQSAAPPPRPLQFAQFDDIPEAELPTRPWLVEGLALRGSLSLITAPGATGKSTFALELAMCMAAGRKLAGFTVRGRSKVLVINAEDDAHEQARRYYAGLRALRMDPADLGGRLLRLDLAENADLVIATVDPKTHQKTVRPVYHALKELVKTEAIDCIIIDPFIETFEANENDNSDMKAVGALWRQLIRDANAAGIIVHHTRKGQGQGGDQDMARGASALVNLVRCHVSLSVMDERAAEAFAIGADERRDYVRIDDAKMNYAPAARGARWLRKIGVQLANTTDDAPADWVGAVVDWTPPGMLDGLSNATVVDIMRAINRGRPNEDGDYYHPPQLYSLSRTGAAAQTWVGRLIAQTADKSDDWAADVVKTWLESGLLVRQDYQSLQRKPREGVVADMSKAPGIDVEVTL